MMFASQDEFHHLFLGRDARDLIGVEIRWIKNIFPVIAVAPSFAGKGVDREMTSQNPSPLTPSAARWRQARTGRRLHGRWRETEYRRGGGQNE